MRNILVYLHTMCFLALCGCSGGGGGESNAGGRPETGFRVMHAGIDFPPVDVVLVGSEGPALGRIRYAQTTGYFPAKGEPQAINLLRANVPDTIVASTVLPLLKGEVKTVLLYGDRGRFGEKVSVIEDPLVELTETQSAIRVIHGAVGAAEVAASAGGNLITDGLLFGSGSSYLTVSSGALVVRARRVADSSVIYSNTLTVEPGKRYTLLLSGEVEYLVTGALIQD